MHRTYYTLCELIDGYWRPQFGDYDRTTVAIELRDRHSDDRIPTKNMRIVSHVPGQRNMESAIERLNQS